MIEATEAQVQKAVLEYLWIRGIFCWRNNTGAARMGNSRRYVHFGFPGSSDILGVLPDGRFLAVEVKKNKGRLRKEQKYFLSRIRECGGVAFVARAVEDVQRKLKEVL
jgi:hypothetical protein